MLDQKKIEDSIKRAGVFVSDGTIRRDGTKEFVKFFLDNAEDSLNSAESLLH